MEHEGEEGSRPSTASGEDVSLDAIPLHSTNLLTVLDANGVIRYESPSIERVFGYDQDELVGEPVAEYFHPADRDAVLAAFRAVVTSEEHTVEAVEYRHERADGTYCWVESVASTNPTPQGYYVVNTRDVSDRKARERDLRRRNERLDEFASVLSHDLRNPLQVAIGQLDLATETGDSEHLARVERAHARMRTLIEDLRTLAYEGETVGDLEPVELPSIVLACWRNVETGDARLVTATDRVVRADRSRLQQLLENLVRNAVDHGGSDVTLTLGDLEDGFYLEDDGPGIPEEEREDVFDLGYSTAAGGTGLGLGISKGVVEAHGWNLRLTEGSDGGARIEVTDVVFER